MTESIRSEAVVDKLWGSSDHNLPPESATLVHAIPAAAYLGTELGGFPGVSIKQTVASRYCLRGVCAGLWPSQMAGFELPLPCCLVDKLAVRLLPSTISRIVRLRPFVSRHACKPFDTNRHW